MTHPVANVIATAMLVELLRAQRLIGLDRDNILPSMIGAYRETAEFRWARQAGSQGRR